MNRPMTSAEVGAQLAATVEAELASRVRLDDEVERLLASRREQRRRGSSPSAVFTLRLDITEVDALERRAAAWGVRPSVLARNLIRRGLRAGPRRDLVDAVDALDEAVALLREAAS